MRIGLKGYLAASRVVGVSARAYGGPAKQTRHGGVYFWRLQFSWLQLITALGTLVMTFGCWTVCAQPTNSASSEIQTTASEPQADNSGIASGKPETQLGAPELGRQAILRVQPRPRMFQVYSDTQYMYDSNILLADGEFIQVGDDSVFIEDAGATFSPPLIEPLLSTVYYHHTLVRYDEFSKFDYDGDAGGVHLAYPVNESLGFYGDFSASRDYFRHGGEEFYKFFSTKLGVGREERIGKYTSLVYGYQLEWRPASPSDLNRLDNAGYLGLNVAVIRKLTAQFFYRARVREYYRADHTDLDHLLNFTLVYAFNDNISARFYTTYAVNNSTESDRDYNVVNVGGGLGLSLKF